MGFFHWGFSLKWNTFFPSTKLLVHLEPTQLWTTCSKPFSCYINMIQIFFLIWLCSSSCSSSEGNNDENWQKNCQPQKNIYLYNNLLRSIFFFFFFIKLQCVSSAVNWSSLSLAEKPHILKSFPLFCSCFFCGLVPFFSANDNTIFIYIF